MLPPDAVAIELGVEDVRETSDCEAVCKDPLDTNDETILPCSEGALWPVPIELPEFEGSILPD